MSGGRLPGGRDATAKAAIANGQVVAFEVTDPGADYVPPLAVVVAPGAPIRNAIPVWAAAGAFELDAARHGALRDGGARPAPGGRPRRPDQPDQGLSYRTAALCLPSDMPALATCQPFEYRSALAWRFYPADPEHRMPSMLGKNGALPGFSAELVLMPEADLAVIALTNSNSFLNAAGVADVWPSRSPSTSCKPCFKSGRSKSSQRPYLGSRDLLNEFVGSTTGDFRYDRAMHAAVSHIAAQVSQPEGIGLADRKPSRDVLAAHPQP